jgi:hypothetical protein
MAKSDLLAASKIYGWHIYVISEAGNQFCKIGTARNLKYRIDGLGTGNPRPLKLVNSWHLSSRDEAFKVEREILNRLVECRVAGREWFECPPRVLVDAVDIVIRDLRSSLWDQAA